MSRKQKRMGPVGCFGQIESIKRQSLYRDGIQSYFGSPPPLRLRTRHQRSAARVLWTVAVMPVRPGYPSSRRLIIERFSVYLLLKDLEHGDFSCQ